MLWSTNAQTGTVDVWFDGTKVVTAAHAKTKADTNTLFFQTGLHRKDPSNFVDTIYLDEFIEADSEADAKIAAPTPENGGGGTGGAGGMGGAAGAGGGSAAGAGGSSSPLGGMGGVVGTAGTTGGGAPSGGGMTSGSGGTGPVSTGGTTSTGTAGTGTTPVSTSSDSGGCSLTIARTNRETLATVLLVLVGFALRRRRGQYG